MVRSLRVTASLRDQAVWSLPQAVPQLASVQCIASLASAFEVWNAILRIDLTKLAETLGTVTVPQTVDSWTC